MAKNFDVASLQDSQIKIHNAMPSHETSDVLAHDLTHINQCKQNITELKIANA